MSFDDDFISFENENNDWQFVAMLIGLHGLKKGWLRFDKPRKRKNYRRDFSKSTKKFTLITQNYRCRICGISLDIYDFDHINGDKSDNSIPNCQALCPNCHAKKTRRQSN